ncbi:hypothetical protein [Hyphomicrobium sp. CS1BSMeth3]|uniref:hypothetical protein n=1 Tax=Hyphomicrobium sp. CS1BSMeth3 TaxID=1892844 RepID=UPI000931FE13|nr:hypothetical protein [Hyphomicrobium sp. CS1BSMeth3]
MTAEANTDRVIGLFERLPALVEANADLVKRGRFLTTDFALVVGATPLLVRVEAGRVTSVARGPFLLRPWTFSITAAPETWLKLLKPVPDPGTHDLMALSKVGLARIEGNLQPFMANLQVIKDIVTAPRALM